MSAVVETVQLSDASVNAAALVIDKELRFYGHFKGLPTYEEMMANDPIGASEFAGIVERALLAALKADQLT